MDNRYSDNVRGAPRRSARVRRTAESNCGTQNRQPSTQPQHNPSEVIDLTVEDEKSLPSTTRSNDASLGNGPTINDEVIDEDDICPICQLLLHRPVTTICNHTLCESCMATWADVSVLSQMQIVDVDEAPAPFDAVSGLEARCPMCRTQTSASLNQAIQHDLQARYPKTYAEREAEDHTANSTNARDEIQTLTLSIGNHHRLINTAEDSGNVHEWTFFVRPSRTDIVEEVHIHLHPTFRPSRIIRTRAPYEIRRLGWGYFTIVANVMLKPGYSWVSEDAEDSPDGAEKGILALEWTLDFEGFGGRGSMGRLRLKVRNQRNWEDVDDEEEEDQRVWGRLIRQYESDGRYVPEEEL